MLRKSIFTITFMFKSLKGFGWNNGGPASQAVAQHCISIGPMYHVIWVVVFLATGGGKCHPHDNCARRPANTGRSPNPVSKLGQRLRRWAKVETVLSKWHLFARVLLLRIQQTQCWNSFGPASGWKHQRAATLTKH